MLHSSRLKTHNMNAYCVYHNGEEFLIDSYQEFQDRNDTAVVHFIGTYHECEAYINRSIAAQELIDSANREHEEYFIQDETWPSRKWNADLTDYIDLSGK